MKYNNKNGITLMALVITIIVLLILAGIALNAISGKNGILTNAKKAKAEFLKAELIDKVDIDVAKRISDGDEITEQILKEILEQYGTLEGEGSILEQVLVTEDELEINVSDIYKDELYVKPPPKPGIYLSKKEIILKNKVTETVQDTLSASVSSISEEIVWSISDSTIATLSSNSGEEITIVAKKIGSAVITAAAGGYEATCNLTVDGPNVVVTKTTRRDYTASITVNVTNRDLSTGNIKFSYWMKEDSEDDTKYVELSTNTTETTVNISGIDGMNNYNVKIIATDESDGSQGQVIGSTGMYCFVAGTKVLTEEGLKNIEDIKLGDMVYTLNLNNNQRELKMVDYTYTGITYDLYEITIGDEIIKATPRHEFYIMDKGWIRAFDIKSGDYLIGKSDNPMKIEKIEYKSYNEPIKIYNLTVEGNHNYLITEYELLVHNAGSK